MPTESEKLEKQLRTLRKQLERSEADRAELEITKEKGDALLHKVIIELRDSKKNLELKSTELEQTLQELHSAQDELIQAEKMSALGLLVAGVAHEINTPIGVGVTAASHMQSAAQALLDTANKNQLTHSSVEKSVLHIQESADIVLRNLSRAADLIQNFKQVAVDCSLQGNRVFNITEYLNSVISSVHSLFNNRAVTLSINGPSDLLIDSDPGSFAQIITNFITNSLAHAFAQDDPGNIRIDFETKGDCLRLRYQDDGAGISAAHIKQIYEPFFTTRRGQGRSGLGLNIVFNIVVNKLKGSIHCDSHLGEGSCFTVILPGLQNVTNSIEPRREK
ncbi:MAG: ATP-binding protein [Spongiibacteraceae bacterium]